MINRPNLAIFTFCYFKEQTSLSLIITILTKMTQYDKIYCFFIAKFPAIYKTNILMASSIIKFKKRFKCYSNRQSGLISYGLCVVEIE